MSSLIVLTIFSYVCTMGLLPVILNCGLRMRLNLCWEPLPRHRVLAIPTCITALSILTQKNPISIKCTCWKAHFLNQENEHKCQSGHRAGAIHSMKQCLPKFPTNLCKLIRYFTLFSITVVLTLPIANHVPQEHFIWCIYIYWYQGRLEYIW